MNEGCSIAKGSDFEFEKKLAEEVAVKLQKESSDEGQIIFFNRMREMLVSIRKDRIASLESQINDLETQRKFCLGTLQSELAGSFSLETLNNKLAPVK